ncbi:hypothetical protein [Nitrospira sp. Ecomares 2.1]
MAKKFRQAIDEFGPDSVAYYGSGQLYTQESYIAKKLFKAGIGTLIRRLRRPLFTKANEGFGS